jgi:hypothetical protein
MYCQLQVSERRTGGTGFGLLPTPLVYQGVRPLKDGKNITRNGKKTGLHLLQMARANMLPFPAGWPNGEIPGKTSQLNPRFVLDMMGYPVDWTELPFQNGGPNRSGALGMP